MAAQFTSADLTIIALALHTSCEANRAGKYFFLAADDCAMLGKVEDLRGNIQAGADYYKMAETLRTEGRNYKRIVAAGGR